MSRLFLIFRSVLKNKIAKIFLLVIVGAGMTYGTVKYLKKREENRRLEIRPEVITTLSPPKILATEVPAGVRDLFERFKELDLLKSFRIEDMLFDKLRTEEQFNALLVDKRRAYDLYDYPLFVAVHTVFGKYNSNGAEIVGFRWHREGVEGVLLTRNYRADYSGKDGYVTIRWSVIVRNGVWKFYDLETTDSGVRVSTELAGYALSNDPDLYKEDSFRSSAIINFCRSHYDVVKEAVENNWPKIKDFADRKVYEKLPDRLEALLHYWKCRIAYSERKYYECLDQAIAAIESDSDLVAAYYWKAMSLNRMGRYQDAVDAMRQFIEQAGVSANDHFLFASMLSKANQLEESATEFRRAFDEKPNSREWLNDYRRSLPSGAKADLATRLSKIDDLDKRYFEHAKQAVDEGDYESIQILVKAFGARFASDPREQYLEAAVELHQNQTDAAVKRFVSLYEVEKKKSAIAQRNAISEILDVYCKFHQFDEAYRKLAPINRREVFRHLIYAIRAKYRDGDVSDEEKKKGAALFECLGRLHAVADSDDPWNLYLKAEILRWRGEFAEAAKAYDVALENVSSLQDIRLIKNRKLYNACDAGQGIASFENSKEPTEVFNYLVYFFERKRQFDQLEKLISLAESRKNQPEMLEIAKANLLWNRQDFEGASKQYLLVYEFANANRKSLVPLDRLLLSLIRVEQYKKALEIIDKVDMSPILYPLYFAVRSAKAGDVKSLETNLMDMQEIGAISPHYDSELGPMLRTNPDFKHLLKKYPIPEDLLADKNADRKP